MEGREGAAATTGMVANITVYDAQGRLIKRLVKNELLASQGFFQWDGTDDGQRKAPIGYYVLFIELFNLQDRSRVEKKPSHFCRDLAGDHS